MNALDGRNQSSTKAGTGGLLQAATYVSGLSGGSWLVTSLALTDYPTIQNLIFPPPSSDPNAFGGWLADINVFTPVNDTAAIQQFIGTLLEEIGGKLQAGFPVAFADVWSRALARHFVPGTTAENLTSNTTAHGAGITFSSIATT
jgi:lysophospholipase